MANDGKFIKAPRTLPFTMVSNNPINDERVGGMPLAIYTYMQSKPDNWIFYVSQIANRFKITRKTASKYVNELISLGYIERFQTRDENGTFASPVYYIYEAPRTMGKNDPSVNVEMTMGKNDPTVEIDQGQKLPTGENADISTFEPLGKNDTPVNSTMGKKPLGGKLPTSNTNNNNTDDDDSINNTERAKAPLPIHEKSSSPENGWTSATYQSVLNAISSWGVDTSMELINRIKADVWQLETNAQTLPEHISVINRLVVAQQITHEHLAEVRNVWSYLMAVYRSLPNTHGLRVQEIYDAHAAVGTAPQRQQLTTDERVVIPTDVDIMNTDWSQFN